MDDIIFFNTKKLTQCTFLEKKKQWFISKYDFNTGCHL